MFETANAGFAQIMYEEFLRDPAAVSEEWRRYFQTGNAGLTPEQGNGHHPSVHDARPAQGAAPAAPAPAARRAALSSRRRVSRVATDSSRKLVAVGIDRLSFMLATSLAAGPVIGTAPGGTGAGNSTPPCAPRAGARRSRSPT